MGWAGIRGSRGEREDQNGLKPIGGSEIGTSLGAGHYPRTNIRTSSQSLANSDFAFDSGAGRGAISDPKGDGCASGITDSDTHSCIYTHTIAGGVRANAGDEVPSNSDNKTYRDAYAHPCATRPWQSAIPG